ncbi:MAG: hypothetical protein M0Z73_03205 [Betaproteobacteria bacterium]|nr:hypothetical protein [Betaproteobacteria bacterium]
MTARHPALAFLFAAFALIVFVPAKSHAGATEQPAPAFTVDGKVALASLVALGDGHLLKLADSLRTLAATPEAQSADWPKIRQALAQVGEQNVAALNWFALPDGTYWSVQEGRAAGNLSTRAYFPKVLAGQAVIGDLVVSKATGKSVAIVAVPVTRPDKAVVGVLGASVYLDQLGARLEREMELDDTMIFFSFDARPLVGLDWDPSLIFVDPTKLGQQDLSRAFRDMLAREEGVARYVFRGKLRTVLFRRSPVTGWWYAFGLVPEGRGTRQR